MLFVKAFIGLLLYDVLNCTLKFEGIYALARKWQTVGDARPQLAECVCRALDYACVFYPKHAQCMQRSFVLTYLLRRNGVHATWVLGAQKLPFKAHAWVEVDGRAINERVDVQAKYAVWDRC